MQIKNMAHTADVQKERKRKEKLRCPNNKRCLRIVKMVSTRWQHQSKAIDIAAFVAF